MSKTIKTILVMAAIELGLIASVFMEIGIAEVFGITYKGMPYLEYCRVFYSNIWTQIGAVATAMALMVYGGWLYTRRINN